jgi:micrococcal nuclease
VLILLLLVVVVIGGCTKDSITDILQAVVDASENSDGDSTGSEGAGNDSLELIEPVEAEDPEEESEGVSSEESSLGSDSEGGSVSPNVDFTPDVRMTDLEEVKVDRVVDGDTVIVTFSDSGDEEKVRLIGVDTPESATQDEHLDIPFGEVASKFTKDSLLNKTAYLEFDIDERDQYGRMLAYLYIDGKMFNYRLLREGYALQVTYPPNVKYEKEFSAAVEAARKDKNGIWALRADYEDYSVSKKKAKYVGSKSSFKFHTLECELGDTISEENKVYFADRDDAIKAGFIPCKDCKP